jgi:hypothetical protein
LPAATSVTANIVQQYLKITTYSLNPLCDKLLRGATEKPSTVVQKLWRAEVVCGRVRKRLEKIIARREQRRISIIETP